MSLSDLTAAAIDAALEEYDSKGGAAFLEEYGFAEAKRYWLVRDGKRYPSKAIAGVAHKFVDGQVLLGTSMFTGGEASVVRRLNQLGFAVEQLDRNPPWTRDELILALDLYQSNPASPPGKGSSEVADLSALLNKLHRLVGTHGTETLRNENGVYMKMMNLRALDPTHTTQGKVGMQSGGKLDRAIWIEYEGRREALAADAAAIRLLVENADESHLATLPPADAYEGEEGGVTIRLHKRYERDPKLVSEKRKTAKALGQLKCEVCSFDFEARYGMLGADYIEVHHTKPVHLLEARSKTKLTDLALVCANCHRMAHRKRQPLGLDELRAALSASY